MEIRNQLLEILGCSKRYNHGIKGWELDPHPSMVRTVDRIVDLINQEVKAALEGVRPLSKPMDMCDYEGGLRAEGFNEAVKTVNQAIDAKLREME